MMNGIDDEQQHDFRTSEGLRRLLTRLCELGAGAWERDAEARELMLFAADKYRLLARKHNLDPWEAVAAAFEAMRMRSTLNAADPWAVVTHAVRITCIAEERGQGLLCSTHQARRAHVSCFHDAERISDRETPLWEYHPAFRVTDEPDIDEAAGEEPAETRTTAMAAAEEAAVMCSMLGWPLPVVRAAIEIICNELIRSGDRHLAHERLRRDIEAEALLEIPRTSWIGLIRIVLGSSAPELASTNAGRGMLLRLLIGESLPSLLRDDELVLAITISAPANASR